MLKKKNIKLDELANLKPLARASFLAQRHTNIISII